MGLSTLKTTLSGDLRLQGFGGTGRASGAMKERLIILAFLLVLVYNEFLLPWLYAGVWTYDHAGCDGEAGCINILAIADPQLGSFRGEPPGLLGWVTRKDAECYVRRAFSTAIERLKPEGVVMLGDLMDDGYTASETDLGLSFNRFQNIFDSMVPIINIAGDDDIGGDGLYLITEKKMSRFQELSGSMINSLSDLAGITFVSVNTLAFQPGTNKQIQDDAKAFVLSLGNEGKSMLTAKRDLGNPIVLLSHLPLSYLDQSIREMLISNIRPTFILTGHVHEYEINKHLLDNSEEIIEVTVPTISYRIGAKGAGFVALTVDRKSGKMWSRMCKLPPRYSSWGLYIAWFMASLTVIYIPVLARKWGCYKPKRWSSWRDRQFL